MIDFTTIDAVALYELEKQREPSIPNIFVETKSENPFINELRFNYRYVYISPYLINNHSKLELFIRENHKEIHLAFIGVNEEERRKGFGTSIMNTITQLADKYGYSIHLDVDTKFGMKRDVLRRFYEKFGFIEHKNIKDTYSRNPKEI